MATYVIWERAEYFRRKDPAISDYIFPECAKHLNAPVTVYVRRIKCLWGSIFDGRYILQVIQMGLDNPILVTIAGFKDFLRLLIRFGDHGNTLDQVLWFIF